MASKTGQGQRLCHIIIHTMSHHHSYYVTSSFILVKVKEWSLSDARRSSLFLLCFFLALFLVAPLLSLGVWCPCSPALSCSPALACWLALSCCLALSIVLHLPVSARAVCARALFCVALCFLPPGTEREHVQDQQLVDDGSACCSVQ